MATIIELQDWWNKDCLIGEDLGQEAIKCSMLHSKYLNELINTKLRLTKLEHEIAALKAKKSKYFRGEFTKEELEESGWKQWQYKTLKNDIADLIEADSDFQTILARHSYVKNAIYFLESVLGEIKSRGFSIRNAVEWAKFRNGS